MNALQQLRMQMGSSQEEVARRLGVSVSTIRRNESLPDPPRKMIAAYRGLFGSDLRSAEPVLRPLSDVLTRHNGYSAIDNERNHHKMSAQSDLSYAEAESMNEPMSIAEVKQRKPEPLPLEGPLAKILGSLPRNEPSTILVSGPSGGGKSTAGMIIVNDLSEHGPVLYVTSEERIDSGTIGIRAEQAGIGDADIDVVEARSLSSIPEHLNSGIYAFCVIDSINELDMTPDDFMKLKDAYPEVSWILISQANAAEKATVGGARWRHLVDIRLWCEVDKDGNRVIRNQKNRFAPAVNEIKMSRGRPLPAKAHLKTAKPNSTNITNSMEDTLSETDNWIVRRLEADLEQARKDAERLRVKLEAQDLQLREYEMRLARYEIRDEIAESGKPRQSLADVFNPDRIASILNSISALAPMIPQLIPSLAPAAHARNTTMMHAPQFQVAQPMPTYLSNPFMADFTTDTGDTTSRSNQ